MNVRTIGIYTSANIQGLRTSDYRSFNHFFESMNYFTPKQHAYRTDTSVISGVSEILAFLHEAFDERNMVEMNLLDLTKAFD